jgi:alpha-L-fucosidase
MRTATYLLAAAGIVCLPAGAFAESIPITLTPSVIVDTSAEPVAKGKFQPSWDSLSQYQCPEWFRDAKFGLWAHWGPQCEPRARRLVRAAHVRAGPPWQYEDAPGGSTAIPPSTASRT